MRNSLFFTLLIAFLLCTTSSFAQTIGSNDGDCVTLDIDGVLTIPPNVNMTISVEAWGAGGGTNAGVNQRAGGGGGGYCSESYAVTGCESFPITVGQGAVAMDGGDTSYDFGTGTVTVGGGGRGVNNPGAGGTGCVPGAAGGARSTAGMDGADLERGGGGGGGSGPTPSPGAPGIFGIGGAGGAGGGAGGAGGSNGRTATIGILGTNGTPPGGGAGGKSRTIGSMPGAAGGHGRVMVCVDGDPTPNIVTAMCDGPDAVLCNGDATGTLTVTPGGGTVAAGYQYAWDDNANQTTATATGLIAGTYIVTVTDDNGCTATCTGTITEPMAITCDSNIAVDATTCTTADGTVTTMGLGGTGALMYDLGTGAQASGSFTGLLPGTYTVTITDADNCQAICAPVIVSSNITLVNDDTGVVCSGGGTSDFADWQTDVNTANPMDVVFSSVTPVGGATPPDAIEPTGDHSAPLSCNSEDQVVMAYLWCDTDASGGDSVGDNYDLLSTYTLTVHPPAKAPMDGIVDCVNTPTLVCGDIFSPVALSPTGGAAAANWDGTTYTAQPGDIAGTINVIVSTGNSCTGVFTITTPACPIPCDASHGTINVKGAPRSN